MHTTGIAAKIIKKINISKYFYKFFSLYPKNIFECGKRCNGEVIPICYKNCFSVFIYLNCFYQ